MKKTRTRNSAADSNDTNSDAKLNRRSFVKLLPAAGAAGLTMANPDAALAQGGQQQTAQRVTR